MSHPHRFAGLGLLGLSLFWLAVDAPRPALREIQFLLEILAVTIATRSMSAGSALSALGLGLGLTVPLMVGAGHAITAAGLDTSEGIVNWGLIPVVEEVLKLVPVGIVMLLRARRQLTAPNPSDLLMLGCFAGAGFALAENTLLIQNGTGIARDMARQYGPHVGGWYLVPGAWGAAGYLGHAAATGMVCAGLGLGLALRTRLGPSWWALPLACLGWIVLEHTLTNYYVGSGSNIALMLGNGRLTPWLFAALALSVVALDAQRARATFAHSAILRRRVNMAKHALLRTAAPVARSRRAAISLLLSQLRLLNATAWLARQDPRLAERKTS